MNLSDVTMDWDRRDRIGIDEAIFCSGKSPEQITSVLNLAEQNSRPLLLTRLDPRQLAALDERHRNGVDYDVVSRTGFFGNVPRPDRESMITVVTAGSMDSRVAMEAVRTLYYHGEDCDQIYDVGVAGLWRLLERVRELREKPVVIVIAGMDAALPSVVAGLVGGLIIAVPTSSGYGVSDSGKVALNAILASCAPGLLAVNIDNGYGAAVGAMRALNALARTQSGKSGGGSRHASGSEPGRAE